MADKNPSDQIAMVHPDLPDTGPVATTRRQLDQVWSKQGWKEHAGAEKDPAIRPRKTTTTADTATKEG